jgi:hypothetical protein
VTADRAGWRLLARLAQEADQLGACDTTAALAAKLLVRTQLVQGARAPGDVAALGAIVGVELLGEIITELSAAEARRIASNLGLDAGAEGRFTAAMARERLIAAAVGDGDDRRDPEPRPVVRTLRRHQSFGARRVRAAT